VGHLKLSSVRANSPTGFSVSVVLSANVNGCVVTTGQLWWVVPSASRPIDILL